MGHSYTWRSGPDATRVSLGRTGPACRRSYGANGSPAVANGAKSARFSVATAAPARGATAARRRSPRLPQRQMGRGFTASGYALAVVNANAR